MGLELEMEMEMKSFPSHNGCEETPEYWSQDPHLTGKGKRGRYFEGSQANKEGPSHAQQNAGGGVGISAEGNGEENDRVGG